MRADPVRRGRRRAALVPLTRWTGLAAGAALTVAGAAAHELPEAAPAGHPPVEAALPVFDFEPPAPGTYRLPAIKPAADADVIDTDGRWLRLHELMRGKVTLLSFVYTRCADPAGCPLATGALFDVFDATATDPGLRGRLRLISLSFDPAYDTPERMAGYGAAALAEAGPGKAPWAFLTAPSEAELAPALAAYGQHVDRAGLLAGSPQIEHLLRVYLVDSDLTVRNIYGVEYLDPRLLLADARTLLLEEAGR